MKSWLKERAGADDDAVFPNARDTQLSPDGVQLLLAKHVAPARQTCPTRKDKRVSLHVLGHTAAMELLQTVVHHSVIALWLGHESAETTMICLQADLTLKTKFWIGQNQ